MLKCVLCGGGDKFCTSPGKVSGTTSHVTEEVWKVGILRGGGVI